jgi:hypothetical protein
MSTWCVVYDRVTGTILGFLSCRVRCSVLIGSGGGVGFMVGVVVVVLYGFLLCGICF